MKYSFVLLYFLPFPLLLAQSNTFPSSGNVGIGTTSPAAKLEVEKPWGSGGEDDIAAFFGGRTSYAGRYNTYIIGHTIGVGLENNTDDSMLWINYRGYQAGASRYRDFYVGNGRESAVLAVDGSSGYFGVGDSTPSAKISLNGYTPPVGSVWGANETLLFHNGSLGDNDSYGQWWKWNVYREAGTSNYRYLDYQNRPNAAEIFMSEDGIRFRTATHAGNAGDILSMKDVFFVRNDGNVGVGTYTPDNKLDVKGTIRAEEVIVETGWADYVFRDDYELMELGDVAAFIDREGRLPGVPSADEVQKKGVSVGDTQRILLEKVEELTLHMIKLEKRVRELEEENRLLRGAGKAQ